ncbi:MAG: hypothetical protein IKT38_05255 [Clostridia bacterium]|nr:hypothetical protein [Clostridia bacterium]
MESEKILLIVLIAVFALIIAIYAIKFYIEFFRKIRYYKTEIWRSRSHGEAEYWRRKLKYHKSTFLFGFPLMRHRHHRRHRHKHK